MKFDVMKYDPFKAVLKDATITSRENLTNVYIDIHTNVAGTLVACNTFVIVEFPVTFDTEDNTELDRPIYLTEEMYKFAKQNKVDKFTIKEEGIEIKGVLFRHAEPIEYIDYQKHKECWTTNKILEVKLLIKQINNIVQAVDKKAERIDLEIFNADNYYYYKLFIEDLYCGIGSMPLHAIDMPTSETTSNMTIEQQKIDLAKKDKYIEILEDERDNQATLANQYKMYYQRIRGLMQELLHIIKANVEEYAGYYRNSEIPEGIKKEEKDIKIQNNKTLEAIENRIENYEEEQDEEIEIEIEDEEEFEQETTESVDKYIEDTEDNEPHAQGVDYNDYKKDFLEEIPFT